MKSILSDVRVSVSPLEAELRSTKFFHKFPEWSSASKLRSNSFQILSLQSFLEACLSYLFQSEQM